MRKADKLRRRLDWKQKQKMIMKINKRRMDTQFGKSSSKRTRSRDTRENKENKRKDKEVVRVVEKIKKIGIKVLKGEE